MLKQVKAHRPEKTSVTPEPMSSHRISDEVFIVIV